MLEPNRVKQTARKSTGGRPPRPRSSVFFSSGSTTDSSPTGIQRQVAGRALRTGRSHFLNKLLSNMAEFDKRGEPRNGERGANTSRTSAPELDEIQMWSAPTSNVRGVDEADEIGAAGPSAAPVRNSTDSLKVIGGQASKGRPQCTRCKNMKSSATCEPAPNSKKCLKCYRDHRICSWAVDDSGSSSSGSPHTEDAWSDISDIDEEDHHRGKGVHAPFDKNWLKAIGGKCLRCASFTNNPVCELSNNPSDLKCTKCRRDKQSCSFAPYNGKRRPKGRIVTEDGGDETDDKSEQESREKGKGKGREHPSVMEQSAKGKKNGLMDVRKPYEEREDRMKDRANSTKKDTEAAKEKSSSKGVEKPPAVKPYETGKMKDIDRAKEKEKTSGTEKQDKRAKEPEKPTEKRRVKGLGGKEGDKEGAMKEERKITKDRGEGGPGNVKEKVSKPNETMVQKRKKDTDLDTEQGHLKKRPRPMVNSKSTVPSSSNSRAGPASSPIVAKPTSTFTLQTRDQARPTFSEIHPRYLEHQVPDASTVVQGPSTSADAGAPSAPKSILDRDSQASCAPSQPAPMEVDEDRTLDVIERELSAAERKAALYREVAASILRDAERADQEVAVLKEELIAVVRRQKGAESAVERRRLIEMLCGRDDA